MKMKKYWKSLFILSIFILFVRSLSAQEFQASTGAESRKQWEEFMRNRQNENGDGEYVYTDGKIVTWKITFDNYTKFPSGKICGENLDVFFSPLGLKPDFQINSGNVVTIRGKIIGLMRGKVVIVADKFGKLDKDCLEINSAYDNYLYNKKKYFPSFDYFQLYQTEDSAHFYIQTQNGNYYLFKLTWNLRATFNKSDGNLNYIVLDGQLSSKSDFTGEIVNSADDGQFHVVPVPKEMKGWYDIMVGATADRHVLMGAKTFDDIRFVVSTAKDDDLIRLIGIDNNLVCYVLEFPKSALPKDKSPQFETDSKGYRWKLKK
jgi:hypothetical protein